MTLFLKLVLTAIIFCLISSLTACGGGGSSKASISSFSSVVCGFSPSPLVIGIGVSRVEAEDYDSCEISFSDTNENNSGGEYRQDSVDITASQGASNNFYVSEMVSGEYMEYSLNVEKSGLYTLTYRVLPNQDGSKLPAVLVMMTADGEQEETKINILPAVNTEWINIVRNNIYLRDGPQVLRLKVITGNTNLDYFEFSYIEDTMVTPHVAVAAMGIGINLGNTLDAPSEGAWAPSAQEQYFVAFQEAGFRHVRIPVTWDNHTAVNSPYEITQERIDRVEQVVDWALAQGYYITGL